MKALHTLTLLLIGFALAASPALPQEQQRAAHMGVVFEPTTYSPAFIRSSGTASVLINLYATLVQEDPSGGIMAGISNRWEVSEDGLHYDFWIDPRAAWSDGVPLTPASIAASYNYKAALPDLTAIEGVSTEQISVIEIDGSDVLRVTLTRPSSQFLPYMTQTLNAPLPMHKADVLDLSDPWETPDIPNMVFSGAYAIDQMGDNRIMMTANPHFFGADTVRNTGVVIHIYNEQDRLVYRDIQAGKLDLAIVRGAGQTSFLETALTDYYQPITYPSLDMLVFNPNRAPFDNIQIRRAIALVADMSTEIDLLYSNNTSATRSLLPQHMQQDLFGQIDDAVWPDKQRDFSTARAIMEKHGFNEDNTLEIELEINSAAKHNQMATLMRSRLSQIHIDATITVREWSDHLAKLLENDFGLGRMGWLYDINHPSNFLVTFTTDNQYNFSNVSYPAYDALIERIEKAQSIEELAELTRQAERFLMHDEVLIVPLYQNRNSLLAQPGLRFDPPLFAGFIRLSSIELP